MKYDFDLDMVHENSLSLIIEQIKRDSIVLEFGPANGRMTKYLKEQLNCRVYLVEIDEEAGKEALKYGVDLVVGDAEQYEWFEKYRDVRFDYIVFADVLEHLRDPENLIVQAKHLMKPEGTIILSVPNLAHNAVLIDLFNNKFEYNPTGLLDNTHIHMFTKNSLENMLARAGVTVESRRGINVPVGQCEIVNTVNDVKNMDALYWNSREYGEVYQFIYSVKRGQEYVLQEVNELPKHSETYYAQVFKGEHFEEENSIRAKILDINGHNVIRFNHIGDARKLRFDPMNGGCVVELHRFVAKTESGRLVDVDIKASNARLGNNNIYIFDTTDPCMECVIQTEESVDYIEVEMNFVSIDRLQIEKIVDAVTRAVYLFNTEEEYTNVLEEARADIKKELVDEAVSILQEEVKELEKSREEFGEELKTADVNYDKLKEEYEKLKLAYEQKDLALDNIYHSRSWRYTRFFRRSL